jgi:hypothetical protein
VWRGLKNLQRGTCSVNSAVICARWAEVTSVSYKCKESYKFKLVCSIATYEGRLNRFRGLKMKFCECCFSKRSIL